MPEPSKYINSTMTISSTNRWTRFKHSASLPCGQASGGIVEQIFSTGLTRLFAHAKKAGQPRSDRKKDPGALNAYLERLTMDIPVSDISVKPDTQQTPGWDTNLSVSGPSRVGASNILILDSYYNDVAEIFYAECATVHMPYADALALAHKMAAAPRMYELLVGLRPLVVRAVTSSGLSEEEAIRTTWLGHLDAALALARGEAVRG